MTPVLLDRAGMKRLRLICFPDRVPFRDLRSWFKELGGDYGCLKFGTVAKCWVNVAKFGTLYGKFMNLLNTSLKSKQFRFFYSSIELLVVLLLLCFSIHFSEKH